MGAGRESLRRLLAMVAALALAAAPSAWRLSDEDRRALDAVSADSLRGHLSFLASDALGGRVTPSAGQQVAAEYIAAQFRRAGLEPLGDDAYFQTAPARVATPRAEGFRFTVTTAEGTDEVPAEAFEMSTAEPVALDDVALVALAGDSVPDSATVAGRAVLTEIEDVPPGAGRREAAARRRERMRALFEARPALVVAVDRRLRPPTGYFDTPMLVDPAPRAVAPARLVTASAPALARAFEVLAAGPPGRLTLHLAEPRREEVPLRNVAGLLRGSDPALAGTYVLVSAHYDGTGPQPGATGPDRIWNGANDDGSGTVTVIELASALSRLHPRPRRSIVFLAFFGEEKGLLGSAWYAAHPLVPLAETVADLNLEHLGRTDSTERGRRAGTASLTGFDYSDLPVVFEAAGRATGIDVYKDARRSDPFFAASDNYPLAEAGVVAHTVCVLFEDFADYHGAGDEWPKIDFPNMEREVRLVGAALLMVAQSREEPRWRADVPPAAPFLLAWRQRHGG